ncbi:MAG: cobalt ECF transporter T component CbiQ [Oscillatoriales cyanobacterium RM2_1_1]|nr:cobalt ECF transporter T component CbiQ [Oscillatoriales cyanobacterium SM2_3_0]NJO46830.1 cobalt ECF transporter T component CbiQ [Oscillatoriales cyanobacterium RM2_1_1]
MKLAIDQYAHLSSPIHRWDARYKLIGLLTLIFAFAFVEDLRLVPVMLLVVVGLYWLSRLPLEFLTTRLQYPGIFILAMVGILPFLSGETVLWRMGFLTIRQEGSLALILVLSRFLAIFTTGLVLCGTGSFIRLVKAMRSLGLSRILTDMILLVYRYLTELSYQLTTMQHATQLRGFQPLKLNRRNLEIYAALAGSLLVRSYHQSQEVYQAMQLRGYGVTPGSAQAQSRVTLDTYSAIALLITLGVSIGLIGFEVLA